MYLNLELLGLTQCSPSLCIQESLKWSFHQLHRFSSMPPLAFPPSRWRHTRRWASIPCCPLSGKQTQQIRAWWLPKSAGWSWIRALSWCVCLFFPTCIYPFNYWNDHFKRMVLEVKNQQGFSYFRDEMENQEEERNEAGWKLTDLNSNNGGKMGSSWNHWPVRESFCSRLFDQPGVFRGVVCQSRLSGDIGATLGYPSFDWVEPVGLKTAGVSLQCTPYGRKAAQAEKWKRAWDLFRGEDTILTELTDEHCNYK